MRLVSDYPHRTPPKGRCRVRIYEPTEDGDHFVVVFSEVAENEGRSSVTNTIEQLAADVILAHALPSKETVVIEHYPAASRPTEEETFDLVTFSHADPEPVLRAGVWRLELGEPEWSPIDRQAVETLLGQPFR